MCCEQDPRGTCVEQADIDPGEIEVVEAAVTAFSLTLPCGIQI